MQPVTSLDPSAVGVFHLPSDSNHSGVSWSAVIAGASAAAVLSLLLFILGFGLGLSSLSPWHNEGVEASTLGWVAIAWVAFTQIAAAGLGGYLAGRLRVKWSQLHGDEVYFRDTAHGFLAWAVASLITAVLLSSVTAAVVNGGVKAGAAVATATTAIAAPAAVVAGNTAGGSGDGESTMIDYYVDNVFHTLPAATEPGAETVAQSPLDATDRAEVSRIFIYSLANGELRAEDKSYLGQMLARHKGMSTINAETRVSAVYNQMSSSVEHAKTRAKSIADDAKKAAAHAALWMFIALLCGAFIASVTAIVGGRQRDSVRELSL